MAQLTPMIFSVKIKPKKEENPTKKKEKLDKRILKKEGEELQQWLTFKKRGSKVENGKKYNRQKFKKGLDN